MGSSSTREPTESRRDPAVKGEPAAASGLKPTKEAIVVHGDRPDDDGSGSGPRVDAVADAATVALLPALTLYLGFNAGGYFADTTGWAAAVVGLALAVRLVVSGSVLRRPGLPLLVPAAALALFALWTLLSGGWADDYARSMIEFDRALLYLLTLLLFGSIADPRRAFRYLPLAFGLAALILCAAGLVTALLPDSWPFELPVRADRLAYPITYSNGLGALAALGIVFAIHAACWQEERWFVRCLGAAAIPLLVATLVLTFSRGAIIAAAVGVLVYLAVGRPRGFVAGLLATVPFAVLAAAAAQGADVLGIPTEALSRDELHDNGAELARIVALTMAGAGGAMALLVAVERRASGKLRALGRRWSVVVGVAGAVAVVAGAIAFGPEAMDRIREDIRGDSGQAAQGEAQTRDRLVRRDLVDLDRQARADYWEVSLDAFEAEPLRGTGAGTFADHWARDRPNPESVTEGHSVYLETLGELGLVGLVLLLAFLVTMMVAFFVGVRRISRPLYGVALAAGLAWLVHAGIDWDWESPALTLWLFAFGGTALGAWSHERAPTRGPAWPWRGLVAAALVLAVITPIAVATSQVRLDDSVTAFLDGDCARAEERAASASSVMPPRPEPYEILAYCAAVDGEDARALRLIDDALDRDPHNWELVYGLAWVRSAAGKDPRPAVARLRRMNPLDPLTAVAVARTKGDRPSDWSRLAATAPVPLP